MFKKCSQKNIRRRREDDEDEEHQHTIQTKQTFEKPKMALKKKEKSKKKESKSSLSMLSFDDPEGEGEEVVIVKKSSRSKKIAKQIKKMNIEDKNSKKKDTGVNNFSSKLTSKPAVKIPDYDDAIAEEVTGMVSAPEKKPMMSNIESGIIPDANMIHAARKQREMLRKFGSEFVPTAESTQQYKQSQSRIIREDDNDASSDEEGTMEMRGLIDKNNGRKKLVDTESFGMEEQDEEVNLWEQELMKKGGYTQNVQHDQPPLIQNQQHYVYDNYASATMLMAAPPLPKNVNKTPGVTGGEVTISSVKSRLQKRIDELKANHRKNADTAAELLHDKQECEDISQNLKDTTKVSEEYKFFQEIRQYTLNVVGCLREKLPQIQALESATIQLWKNNAHKLAQRRSKDMQDESSQCSGLQPDKSTGEGEEFFTRVREREARRARRARERQKQRGLIHYEGMSTDDEEGTSDKAVYNSEMVRVNTEQKDLFGDVVADFSDIGAILEKFRHWRKEHSTSYYDAFIALCIPSLLMPYVRYKLIMWNPLRDSNQSWENFDWYKTITKFSLEEWKTSCPDDEDMLEDAKIISAIVEKSIFQRIGVLVTDIWNPLSSTQTELLVNLFKQLIDDEGCYPFMSTENHACQVLIKKVCKGIQKCLNNDVYIPFGGGNTANELANRFFERQSWSAIKLFKNIMLMHDYLSFDVVRELAFDALLNRYIMLSLQTSPMDVKCLSKCSTIVQSIPDSLLAHSGTEALLRSLSQFLQHFCDSVKHVKTPTNAKMEEKLMILVARLEKVSP